MKGLWGIWTDWGQVRSHGWSQGWSAWRKVGPAASQSAQEMWKEGSACPVRPPRVAAPAQRKEPGRISPRISLTFLKPERGCSSGRWSVLALAMVRGGWRTILLGCWPIHDSGWNSCLQPPHYLKLSTNPGHVGGTPPILGADLSPNPAQLWP